MPRLSAKSTSKIRFVGRKRSPIRAATGTSRRKSGRDGTAPTKCFKHVGEKVSNRDDAAMLWRIARREAPHLAASAGLPNLQRRHSVASTTTAPKQHHAFTTLAAGGVRQP